VAFSPLPSRVQCEIKATSFILIINWWRDTVYISDIMVWYDVIWLVIYSVCLLLFLEVNVCVYHVCVRRLLQVVRLDVTNASWTPTAWSPARQLDVPTVTSTQWTDSVLVSYTCLGVFSNCFVTHKKSAVAGSRSGSEWLLLTDDETDADISVFFCVQPTFYFDSNHPLFLSKFRKNNFKRISLDEYYLFLSNG